MPPQPPSSTFQTYPFKSIYIDRLLRGGTQITWVIEPVFGAESPWSFAVQWGRPGTKSWTTVATVVDTFFVVDPLQRDFSSVLEGFYRVVLTDANGVVYQSQPSDLPSTWTLRDFKICNSLRNKEDIYAQREGLDVWILYRKNWGLRCTVCLDDTTGEPRNPNCPNCFGTGIAGGYYDPYSSKGVLLQKKSKTQQRVGTETDTVRGIRMSPVMIPMEKDAIVVTGLDTRFIITDVEVVAERKGRPIVANLTLDAAPVGHAIYDLVWRGPSTSISPAPQVLAAQTPPFKSIYIDRLLRGGTQITWAMEPSFGAKAPWSFAVQWGRPGTESWTAVTTVTDTFFAVDPERRDFSSVLEGFYRVVLTDANGVVYESRPSALPSTWTTRDFKICNALRDREDIYAQREGLDIWILYRKNWGTKCTVCVDETTGETRNPNCPTCFGTGIVGGYHSPYRSRGVLLQKKSKTQQRVGTETDTMRGIRVSSVAIPMEKDAIILDGTDVRFIVTGVDVVAERKGRAIVANLTLDAAPVGHAVYDLTWNGTVDPSAGENPDW